MAPWRTWKRGRLALCVPKVLLLSTMFKNKSQGFTHSNSFWPLFMIIGVFFFFPSLLTSLHFLGGEQGCGGGDKISSCKRIGKLTLYLIVFWESKCLQLTVPFLVPHPLNKLVLSVCSVWSTWDVERNKVFLKTKPRGSSSGSPPVGAPWTHLLPGQPESTATHRAVSSKEIQKRNSQLLCRQRPTKENTHPTHTEP